MDRISENELHELIRITNIFSGNMSDYENLNGKLLTIEEAKAYLDLPKRYDMELKLIFALMKNEKLIVEDILDLKAVCLEILSNYDWYYADYRFNKAKIDEIIKRIAAKQAFNERGHRFF